MIPFFFQFRKGKYFIPTPEIYLRLEEGVLTLKANTKNVINLLISQNVTQQKIKYIKKVQEITQIVKVRFLLN